MVRKLKSKWLDLLPEGLPAWPEVEGFHVALEWDPGGRPRADPGRQRSEPFP